MQAIALADLPYFAAYAALAILSNWSLQKTYQTAEASVVQPFSYLQIVFVSGVGMVFYNESLALQVAIGAGVVVAAGLYALTLDREKKLPVD
jgi:drug/metabolite transporter (DMT)-like permease